MLTDHDGRGNKFLTIRLSGGAIRYRWDCPLGCEPQVYAIVHDWRDLAAMVAEHNADDHATGATT